jgi:hypothetical protein
MPAPTGDRHDCTSRHPWEAFIERSVVRRIAVYAIIAALLFCVLWYTIFNAVTASLIAASGAGILVVGSTVSDIFESLFELLASIVLAAITAVVAAIFSFFDSRRRSPPGLTSLSCRSMQPLQLTLHW